MTRQFTQVFELTRTNDAKREVDLSFASETPCEHDGSMLILDMRGADLSRVNTGNAPLLWNHNTDEMLGTVVRAWVDGGKARARVRFGNSQRAKEAWQDVQDGVITSTSLRADGLVLQPEGEGVRRAVKWRTVEVSLVSMPADTTVGVNRSAERKEITMQTVENEADKNRREGVQATCDHMVRLYPERSDEFKNMTARALLAGTDAQAFGKAVLEKIGPAPREVVRQVATDYLGGGVTQRDVQQFDIARAIQSCVERMSPVPDGYEGEISRTLAKAHGVRAEGIYMPLTAPVQRTMTVGSASGGGNMVPTQTQPVIEYLRNKMACQRLGVRMLTGLSGHMSFPRQTGTATPENASETGSLTPSQAAVGLITCTPHRIGATTPVSRQLIIQTGDAQKFVSDDLTASIATLFDRQILDGTGSSNQIQGIKNVSGVGAVTFSGAATWAKILEFESDVAASNADDEKLGYLISPAARAKWKNILKVSGGTSPAYIYEAANWGDGSNDGLVNSYRCAATNQAAGDLVYYGNWNDVVAMQWGGADIVVDPYTRAKEGIVEITSNIYVDVLLRHPASFSISSDSGAQ